MAATTPWWETVAKKIGKGIACMFISSIVGYYLGVAGATTMGAKRGGGFWGGLAGFVAGVLIVGPVLSTITLAGSALWGVVRGFDTIPQLWGNTFNLLMRAATGEKIDAKEASMLLTGSLDTPAAANISVWGQMANFFSNSWDHLRGKGETLDIKVERAEAALLEKTERQITASMTTTWVTKGLSVAQEREMETRILSHHGKEVGIGGVPDSDNGDYSYKPQPSFRSEPEKPEVHEVKSLSPGLFQRGLNAVTNLFSSERQEPESNKQKRK